MLNQTKYPYTLIKFDKGICLMGDDNTYSSFADLLSSKVSIEDTKKLYDEEGYDTLNDETGKYDPIYTLSVYLTEYEEHHGEWMWLYNKPYLDITYNNYHIFFLEKMPELVKQAFRLVWKACNSYVVDDCLALARFINEYNYKLEQTSVQQEQEPVNTTTPQVHQPTEQTSVQEEQHPVASIDQEVMTYLNNYDDTFSYEGYQDYQEVYIPTPEVSSAPQQPVVTTPPKQYELSKEYMDKFATGGLSIFTNATVHNWQ